MKTKIFALLLLATMVGCSTIEKVVVEKAYPKVEQKVVEETEKAFKDAIENGLMTEEEAKVVKPIVYRILIQVRDKARVEVFGEKTTKDKEN